MGTSFPASTEARLAVFGSKQFLKLSEGLKSGVVATGSQARVAATATTTENPQHEPTMASEHSSAAAL